MLLVYLVGGLFAQHDNDERQRKGEDSIHKDEELSVREAARLSRGVHIVLNHAADSHNRVRNYIFKICLDKDIKRGKEKVELK
jgi:hypothetical protein